MVILCFGPYYLTDYFHMLCTDKHSSSLEGKIIQEMSGMENENNQVGCYEIVMVTVMKSELFN